MRRAFIRGIWGDISPEGIRKGKLYNDIQLIKNNPYTEPFVTYVFGRDNYQQLTSENFDCKLIDESPIRYDMKTQFYRHKLDILYEAMQDFDEIVFLDWDCRPIAKLPADFWDVMGEKAPFQANLFQYRTKKCLWRTEDWRKVCNGGFLYIRDAKIAKDFKDNYRELLEWVFVQKEARIKLGKELRFREEALIFDDEPSITKWVDDYLGGWKGVDKYWELFEPNFCNLKRKSAFPKELLETKRKCFLHYL